MILCKLFLVFLVIKLVKSQVCNDTISVSKVVPETYQFTYYEAYKGDDCLISAWCTKSRLAVNVGTRQVNKIVNETINVCCEGYIEDESYAGPGLKCIPVCNPPCHNGYCKNPSECACEPGYAIDPNDALSRCVPMCLEGCSNPDCLSTCNPPPEYDDLYDTRETDMCYGSCLNGTCVAPGVCHCDSGYRRVLNNCEPVCTSCAQGSCIAPGLCECEPGWREDNGTCLPICSECEHGRCTAPGHCECDPGYKADNMKCEPHCSICTSGNCVAPEICVCNPGWYMNEDGECIAHCDVACGNGTCVAPNECACYSGYRIKTPEDERYNEAPRCVPKCYCDGICIAPNVCRCGDGYEIGYTTVDGTKCDCFDCSDVARKCDRVICKKKTNETGDAVTETSESERSTTGKRLEVDPEGLANTINTEALASMNNDNTTSCTNIKPREFTYHWIYAAIIIIESIVIICMLVVLEKKHLLDRLKTKKFIPQGKPRAEVAVHYTSSVTCSKLKETTD